MRGRRGSGAAIASLIVLGACAREPAAPQVSTFDLALTRLAASPSPATVGRSVLLEATVTNQGAELATHALLSFFLDADADEIGSAEELLGEASEIVVLSSGDSLTVATRLDSIPAGEHRFLARLEADDDDPSNDQAGVRVTALGADEIRVHMIDVGQGDAILVEFPEGPKVMVDGGEPEEGPGLLQYLRSAEVNALDLVVSTHQDRDHYGGLISVLRGIPVQTLWRSCRRAAGGADLAELHAVVDSLVDAGGLEVHNVADGRELEIDAESRLSVLNPADSLSTECDAEEDELNELSVVTRVEFGEFEMLLTGDIGTETEGELVERAAAELDVEVVQVPHHGSAFSSSAPFVAAVDAELALISVGADNSFGHPDPGAVQRWSDAGVEVRRTDEEGTLIVVSDGSGFRVIEGVGP